MRSWYEDDPSPTRTLVYCLYGGARDIPRSVVIRETQRRGGAVVSGLFLFLFWAVSKLMLCLGMNPLNLRMAFPIHPMVLRFFSMICLTSLLRAMLIFSRVGVLGTMKLLLIMLG